MTIREKLNSPPIREAVIDFRVTPRHLDQSVLTNLQEKLGNQFPKVEKMNMGKVSFSFKGEPKARQSKSLIGYRFLTDDGKLIAQFRNDGFTLNRMKPYNSWEDLTSEAFRLWVIYVELIKPGRLTRIAVRYINDIQLPLPTLEIDDYISLAPKAPNEEMYNYTNFLSRVALVSKATGISANVIQALENSLKTDSVTYILDIDVYSMLTDTDTLSEQFLRERFEAFRVEKNRLFFGSLTDKTLELLK